MCRHWAASGTCYYGDSCNYLHVSAGPSGLVTGPPSLREAMAARSVSELAGPSSSSSSVVGTWPSPTPWRDDRTNVMADTLTVCGGLAVVESGGHAVPKSQRPCRNIEIYGYCKYAGKGCEYNHDTTVRSRSTPSPSRLWPWVNALDVRVMNFVPRPQGIFPPFLVGENDPRGVETNEALLTKRADFYTAYPYARQRPTVNGKLAGWRRTPVDLTKRLIVSGSTGQWVQKASTLPT